MKCHLFDGNNPSVHLYRFLLLLVHWSATVRSYQIWSIYFDDTVPSINEENRVRKQFFDIPFEEEKFVFQIDSFIRETNQNVIRRLELVACEENLMLRDEHVPNGSIFVNSANGGTYLCLQRIASLMVPMIENQTIVRYPPDVGLPLNRKTTNLMNQKLLLLVEYDTDLSLLQDDSGFDLYVSDEPKSVSAAIMAVGLYPDARFFIPPNVTHWATKGSCYSSCLGSVLNEEDEIQISAIMTDTGHRALEELVLEIDSPRSLPYKIYSWGGESSIDLSGAEPPMVKFMDRLNVRCVYSGGGQSIMGGLAAHNENCLVWLHYYPRIELNACLSSYTAGTMMSLLDIGQLNLTQTLDTGLHISINDKTMEKILAEKDSSKQWQYRLLDRTRYSRMFGKQLAQCGWTRLEGHHELRK